jgi:hypothetical protein
LSLSKGIHAFRRFAKSVWTTALGFSQYGVITLPGEIDLAPDAMHDAIKKKVAGFYSSPVGNPFKAESSF